MRRGEAFPVEDSELQKRWIVHPFLFDCETRDFLLDRESVEGEWVSPTEILRRDTVPQLWTSYTRVAPSVASVNGDAEHGAAYISFRALEVLRDRAALLAVEQIELEEAWEELGKTAIELIDGHPTMAVLVNRLNRAMYHSRRSRSPVAVEHDAHASLERAIADDKAAKRSAGTERYAGNRGRVEETRQLELTGSCCSNALGPDDCKAYGPWLGRKHQALSC